MVIEELPRVISLSTEVELGSASLPITIQLSLVVAVPSAAPYPINTLLSPVAPFAASKPIITLPLVSPEAKQSLPITTFQ